ATTSAPGVSCAFITNDLWYTLTSPTDGFVTVETCTTTSADTVLAAYDTCGGTQLGCDDDGCGIFAGPSHMNFCINANQTVLIRVGGYGGTLWSGTFNVSIAPPSSYTPPAQCIAEGEDCTTVNPDNVNGGCNSTPNVYTSATLCNNYCGTAANT